MGGAGSRRDLAEDSDSDYVDVTSSDCESSDEDIKAKSSQTGRKGGAGSKTIHEVGAKKHTPRRARSGKFCGGKGAVCSAYGCDICWAWLEERDDCTLRVLPELEAKLPAEERKSIDEINRAIAALYAQDPAHTGKYEEAICGLQEKLSTCIESALVKTGMEEVTPQGFEQIKKFARSVDGAKGSYLELSKTLRDSMTKEQREDFGCLNAEHDADAMLRRFKHPKEAMADMRKCAYLWLFAFAHRNKFDFSQEPVWEAKPQTAKAKRLMTGAQKRKKRTAAAAKAKAK